MLAVPRVNWPADHALVCLHPSTSTSLCAGRKEPKHDYLQVILENYKQLPVSAHCLKR